MRNFFSFKAASVIVARVAEKRFCRIRSTIRTSRESELDLKVFMRNVTKKIYLSIFILNYRVIKRKYKLEIVSSHNLFCS